MEMETRRVTINRVSVGSAFKVGALLTGLLMAVFGLLFIVLPSLMGASLLALMLQDPAAADALGGLGVGLVGGLVIYVFAIVIYTILGGIMFAIQALLYNIVAGIVGGIEMDLS